MLNGVVKRESVNKLSFSRKFYRYFLIFGFFKVPFQNTELFR